MKSIIQNIGKQEERKVFLGLHFLRLTQDPQSFLIRWLYNFEKPSYFD